MKAVEQRFFVLAVSFIITKDRLSAGQTRQWRVVPCLVQYCGEVCQKVRQFIAVKKKET